MTTTFHCDRTKRTRVQVVWITGKKDREVSVNRPTGGCRVSHCFRRPRSSELGSYSWEVFSFIIESGEDTRPLRTRFRYRSDPSDSDTLVFVFHSIVPVGPISCHQVSLPPVIRGPRITVSGEK